MSSLSNSLARFPSDTTAAFARVVPVCGQDIAVIEQGRGEMATGEAQRRPVRIFEFIQDVLFGGIPRQALIVADDASQPRR